jgi:hypothetical protein
MKSDDENGPPAVNAKKKFTLSLKQAHSKTSSHLRCKKISTRCKKKS